MNGQRLYVFPQGIKVSTKKSIPRFKRTWLHSYLGYFDIVLVTMKNLFKKKEKEKMLRWIGATL